MNDVKIL